MKILNNIYLIGSSEISDPKDCCVYLIDTGELVMIDAGAVSSPGRLIDNIMSLELPPEKLSTVIVTHAHIDHIGALHYLKKMYGVKIIAHRGDADAITSGKRVGAEYYGVKYLPCDVDIIIEGSENKLLIGNVEFSFLHVPGHTPGSMVVTMQSEGSTVLFGQDIHGPYLPMWGGDIKSAIVSLQKIKSLKADILCEGHYGIIRPAEAISEFIQEYIEMLQRR